jgi:aquaglyceroporin related protein
MASPHRMQISPQRTTASDHEDDLKEKDFGFQQPPAVHNVPTATASHHEHRLSDHESSLNYTSSGLSHRRAMLGLHPSAPIEEEHDLAEHSDLWWPKVRLSLKEPFAEFFGVFIMVLFGDGSVAQVLLNAGAAAAPGGGGYGSYQSINWGWGLGVMLGIYVSGDSGAYLKYTGPDPRPERFH